jgi:hypothetical protein
MYCIDEPLETKIELAKASSDKHNILRLLQGVSLLRRYTSRMRLILLAQGVNREFAFSDN